MSFADTFDFPSPDEQESDLRQALQWFSEIARLDHTFSEDDAINLANMARLYPTASAEVLTAAAEARIPYDLPSLAEVMAKEHETGGNFLSGIYDRVKWVSRNALMVAD